VTLQLPQKSRNAAAPCLSQEANRELVKGPDSLQGGTTNQQSSQKELQIEKLLGSLALQSPESVDVASRLVDLAVAKVGKSRFKDLYAAKAIVLSGTQRNPADFRNDKTIQDFARVWQEEAFEKAVQCLCVAQGFARGQWNVSTSVDYPGQPMQTEARFSLHWAMDGRDSERGA